MGKPERRHGPVMEQERLFQLIAGLTGCLDRSKVVETIQSLLGVQAVEQDDCVVFDDLGLRFGDNGRVLSVYRIIDGATKPAEDDIDPQRWLK